MTSSRAAVWWGLALPIVIVAVSVLSSCSRSSEPRAGATGSGLGWRPAEDQLEERFVPLTGLDERPRRTLLFRPRAWSADREWPLLVALPGSGSNPDDWIGYPRFLELADRHGFVVVVPSTFGVGSGDDRYGFRAALRRYLEDVVAMARSELSATGEQWLIGGSAGGAGVWRWALRDPESWTGWIAVSPAGVPSAQQLSVLAEHRVMVVQGLADRAVYVPHTKKLVRELARQRLESCSVLLEHAGHRLHEWPVMEMVFGFVTEGRCGWP